MSPLVRNLMLGVALAATVLGAVRAMAALPHHLHGAGIPAPATWEQLLADVLEAR
jgi:hypothetical protein